MKDGQYIGIDLGTTGVKAGLFTADGRELAIAHREFELDTPAPGFVELDGRAYIDAALDAVRETLASDGAEPAAVKAIGLSAQGQTFVLLDGDGRPVRPAISWLDVRASAEAEEMSDLSERLIGRRVSAIASGPKLMWLRRHEPETFDRAEKFLLLPDYLIWRLTGRGASDPQTAGSSRLYERDSGQWTPELLELCGLTPEMVPDVLSPGKAAETLTAKASAELGLPESVLVAVGANDQSVGALGAGNVIPGTASLTLGTAMAIVVTAESNDGVPPGIMASHHPAGESPGDLWILLAYAKTAGIVLRWFRDTFAAELSYEGLISEAMTAPLGAGGVSFLPHFSGVATPSFTPHARGAFSGLTLGATRGHMARAVIESLTFTVRDNVDLLAGSPCGVTELRAVGGGSRSDTWLQMIADVTGRPVERAAIREAACLGAAMLAMTAAGAYPSVAEASLAIYSAKRRFEPDDSLYSTYDDAYWHYRKLGYALYGIGDESSPPGDE